MNKYGGVGYSVVCLKCFNNFYVEKTKMLSYRFVVLSSDTVHTFCMFVTSTCSEKYAYAS